MITRHFITIKAEAAIDTEIDGQPHHLDSRRVRERRVRPRRVHYRKAGKGPPLLLVHQSPRSSKEYESLMTTWAQHFTCIAPDTPGFGQSEPLPESLAGAPEIDDYADAVIAFLDALGIKKCAAYGFHSGGIILVAAVKRYPQRITTLAVGGYAVWTAEEMALFSDQYLPEFHPSPYGEHLTWLWNRIIEQSWFFPWFACDNEHRLAVAHADPVRVDAVVREMLDASDAYRAGYGAVLRAPRDIPAVDAEGPPCLISAYDGDPLQEHIDRLGEMPPLWSARKVTTPAQHQADSLRHLLQTKTPLAGDIKEASDEGFCTVKTNIFDGLIHWRRNSRRNSQASISQASSLGLHRPGYDLYDVAGFADWAIDLPGHGLSDDWDLSDDFSKRPGRDSPSDWSQWQAVIDAVAAVLDADTILYPALPVGDPALLYPDLSVERFGYYLVAAWQIVRARHFYAPWYEANKAHAVRFEQEDIAPAKLAREHRALLNAGAAKAYHIALQARP